MIRDRIIPFFERCKRLFAGTDYALKELRREIGHISKSSKNLNELKEEVIENLQATSKISPTDIALDKYSEKNSSKLGMDSIVMTQLTPNIGRVPRKIKKSRYNKDYNWIEGLING